MTTYQCFDQCCHVFIEPYSKNSKMPKKRFNSKKAGMFIIDVSSNKVLLIQSRGNLWGLPKGTFESDETPEDCAIREVHEETGLLISRDKLLNKFIIKNQAYYFYVEMKQVYIQVQKHVENNDANAIGWIRVECIDKLIKCGTICLNYHTRLCFENFIKKKFSYSKKKNTDLKICSK